MDSIGTIAFADRTRAISIHSPTQGHTEGGTSMHVRLVAFLVEQIMTGTERSGSPKSNRLPYNCENNDDVYAIFQPCVCACLLNCRFEIGKESARRTDFRTKEAIKKYHKTKLEKPHNTCRSTCIELALERKIKTTARQTL